MYTATDALLALCARAEGHPVYYDRLDRQVRRFTQWADLPARAALHNLGPLLYTHLRAVDAPMPEPVRIALKGLVLRHRHADRICTQSLGEILQVYQQAGIEALVLKGAALKHLIYSQPGLRPVSDLDILVRESQALQAYTMLAELGFQLALSPTYGLDRHAQHLTPAARVSDGLVVSVEIHHHLYRRWDVRPVPSLGFDELADSAISFDTEGVTVHTLGYEDMLSHIYRHAFFQNNLRSVRRLPRVRLIWMADLVSAVERWVDLVDWEKVRREYTDVWNVLPLFHFLSPWSDEVLDRLNLSVERAPQGVGQEYRGYPSRYLAEHLERGVWQSLRDTFFPSEWWLRLYYGLPGTKPALRLGRVKHAVYTLLDLAVYGARLSMGLEKVA